jgi:GrpB-like predicted nucleotidyltransferase (UPF0157 family)
VRVTLSEYDPGWPHRFAAFAADLRRSLLDRGPGRLVAIHHIGSTAVPGLAAKDVIDIQVSVESPSPVRPFEPVEPLREAIEVLGYRWHPDNPDGRKRFFSLDDGDRRLVNLHVRQHGEFSAQAALLLRDLLRADEAARSRYEATKRSLAERDWPTVDDYAEAKGDTVWALLRDADVWAARTAWCPRPSDA